MTNKEIISSLRGLIGKYNLSDDEWQTVEQAINVLSNSDEDFISRKSAEMCLTADITNMTIEEYISMVGDRLKGLPSIQPKSIESNGDYISREEVCDYIAEFVNHEYATDREHEMVEHIIGGIQHLPSIQPKKMGHWISHIEHCKMNNLKPNGLGSYWWRSECDFGLDNNQLRYANYCQNCGAKMEE